MRARLHRTIFFAFGATILASGAVFGLISTLGSSSGRWREEIHRIERFVAHQFEPVWRDPDRRRLLAEQYSRDLDVTLHLFGADGQPLERTGSCRGPAHRVEILGPGGVPQGSIEVCRDHGSKGPPLAHLLAFFAAAFVLWAASGFLARRIARPLRQIGRVAYDIGRGRLSSRVALRGHRRLRGELGQLADAINDMAERIEKQLSDQRELLAAVSHEIRTPLGHLRVLTDTAKEKGVDSKLVADIEREVVEADELVDQLLATSRLDFESVDRRALDAAQVAIDALERQGLPPDLLEVDLDGSEFEGDATLLARALANLIDNARRHGGGMTRLQVHGTTAEVRFAVEDAGPSLAEADRDRVFEPFYRGERRAGATGGTLGLGLSLVSRIAKAHGGRAFAEDCPDGGARVGFTVRRRPIRT